MKKITLLTLLIMVCLEGFCQILNPKKDLKNTIRINLTSPMLFGEKFNAIGYERVLNEKRSFSINLGRFTLPELRRVNTDNIPGLGPRTLKERGFHIVGDYRFYLQKENRHNAPRGVYIGPYATFNTLNREIQWPFETETANNVIDFDLRLNTAIVGFQLGYQFIFWKRFTLDLVLAGPGLGRYDLRNTLKSDLSPEDRQALFDDLYEAISGRFPGFEHVVNPDELRRTGGFKTSTFGFRYVANFGVRF